MALASALERMCADDDERRAMGEIGRKRACTYYRQEQMVTTYTDLYQEVVSSWQA